MEAIDGVGSADLPAAALAPAREQSAAGEEGRRLIMEVRELRVAYGEAEILKGVDVSWDRGAVGALIGPSGCGKTTLLRTLNRLAELAGARVGGRILLDGVDVREQPAHEVRRRVGMVFQRPNPFPMSIFDNIAYALREQARRRPRRSALAERVEQVLRQAQLWDEVKDDLGRSALRLSGGQQQRLCIARTLAAEPDVVLMDEPCASLDPHSTARVEELIAHLRGTVTQIVVTHNLAQARRISDRAAFLLMGELIEQGPSERVLSAPERAETRDFIAGVYG